MSASVGRSAAEIVQGLAAALQPAGLDIVVPLCAGWYNDVAPDHVRLPFAPSDLVVLLGNSRAVWDPFLAAWRAGKVGPENPLDDYVEEWVSEAVAAATGGAESRAYFAHRTTPGELLAVQRMAHVAGLAFLDPGTHLCIHPRFGSWMGLRSAVVFPGVAHPHAPPPPLPCPLSPQQAAAAQDALQEALKKPGKGGGGGEGIGAQTHSDVRAAWRKWLALRDSIHEGHPERYSEEQILYHYTGDTGVLGPRGTPSA